MQDKKCAIKKRKGRQQSFIFALARRSCLEFREEPCTPFNRQMFTGMTAPQYPWVNVLGFPAFILTYSKHLSFQSWNSFYVDPYKVAETWALSYWAALLSSSFSYHLLFFPPFLGPIPYHLVKCIFSANSCILQCLHSCLQHRRTFRYTTTTFYDFPLTRSDSL